VKKFLVCFLSLLILLTMAPSVFGADKVTVNVENTLNVPIFKSFTFEVDKSNLQGFQNFKLTYGDTPLPFVFSQSGDKFVFKSAISLAPNEKKTLTLVNEGAGGNLKDFYVPNFIGTKFIIPQKGKVFIVSYGDGNHIAVVDTKNSKTIFEKDLDTSQFTFVELTYDSVFELKSTLPVFAELSTLTPPFEKNSSDDMSSVYGTYFTLYIPQTLFIATTTDTNIKIVKSDGSVIAETLLKANSYYSNTKLQGGVYRVTSSAPVLIEFGYAEDNVFSTLYGINSANAISFGGLGVSSIFDDTEVTVKYNEKSSTVKLEKANDFRYFDILNSNEYKPNETEYKQVFVEFTKPVLIYTYGQFGNVDGEQIPSFANGTSFKFHTGKVTNTFGERKRRVVIIGIDPSTSVSLNGNSFTLNAFESKTFLFSESFSPVNISSNKPIAVFDLGIEDNKEIFTTLLPVDNYNPLKVVLASSNNNASGTTQPQNNNTEKPSTGNNFDNLINNVKNYIIQISKSVSAFFVGILSNDNLKNIGGVLSTFFKGVASNILSFLRPISEQIYPYVKNYIPDITVDLISSIIFFLFVLIVIILIIPKGKKRNIPVVSVEEVKKKPIAFNVKDLEVKEEKVEAAKEEFGVGEPPKVKTIPIKPPEQIIEETPKEEIEKTRRVFRPVPPRRTEKLTIEKEQPKEKEEEQLKEIKEEVKEPVKLIKEKPEVLESKVEEVEKPVEKEEEVRIEEKVPEKTIQEEQVLPQEKTTQELITPEETIAPAEKEEATPQVIEQPKEEKPTEAKVEAPREEILEEHEPSFADFAQPNLEEIPEEISKIAEPKAEEKEEVKEEKGKKEEFKSTFEELIKKLEEENKKKKELKKEEIKPEETAEVKKEESLGEVSTGEEKTFIKVELKSKFVADAGALRKIYGKEDIPTSLKSDLLSKACISASQKSEVADIVEGRYRVTVIGLTTIEERLAEDIAKRVSGKFSTGEAILIAKKLRLTDVVVDDNPKLKNYQGITIYSVEEVI